MNTYAHVKQPTLDELKEGFSLKGKWRKDFFKNENPIVLELGCGMGEYTVGLAKISPNKNFLGIDIKGARMWQGATQSIETGIVNVGFLRIRIDWIEMCFEENEIDEIWITFPDPQLKKRRANKRLTHPNFLSKYQNILKKGGDIHLKTDSQYLYEFTLDVIATDGHVLKDSTHNLYQENTQRRDVEIKTHYEHIFLKDGKPITYLRFQLK